MISSSTRITPAGLLSAAVLRWADSNKDLVHCLKEVDGYIPVYSVVVAALDHAAVNAGNGYQTWVEFERDYRSDGPALRRQVEVAADFLTQAA